MMQKTERITWLEVWDSLNVQAEPREILIKLKEGTRGVMPQTT